MGRLSSALTALALCASLGASAGAAIDPGPPGREAELTLGGAGWAQVMEGGSAFGRQSEFNEALDLLLRRRLADGPFFWGWGARQELFSFAERGGFPVSHLQDYAAQLSLEYVSGAEALASLVVRPGFYFENVPTLRAWDLPFELLAGVPLRGPVSGVIGIGHGRFYRRPIPVVGLVWTASPRLTVKAAFPEPSIELAMADGTQVKLGGELLGAGFLSDTATGRQSVEYFVYRIGPALTAPTRAGMKISIGAGCEMRRDFEFSGGRRARVKGAPYAGMSLLFAR